VGEGVWMEVGGAEGVREHDSMCCLPRHGTCLSVRVVIDSTTLCVIQRDPILLYGSVLRLGGSSMSAVLGAPLDDAQGGSRPPLEYGRGEAVAHELLAREVEQAHPKAVRYLYQGVLDLGGRGGGEGEGEGRGEGRMIGCTM